MSMQLADLLRERLEIENQDVWENERTPTPVRCFAVRLHSMRLSVREVEAVLDWLGVDRCYQAVWNWEEKLAKEQSDPPTSTRTPFSCGLWRATLSNGRRISDSPQHQNASRSEDGGAVAGRG